MVVAKGPGWQKSWWEMVGMMGMMVRCAWCCMVGGSWWGNNGGACAVWGDLGLNRVYRVRLKGG